MNTYFQIFYTSLLLLMVASCNWLETKSRISVEVEAPESPALPGTDGFNPSSSGSSGGDGSNTNTNTTTDTLTSIETPVETQTPTPDITGPSAPAALATAADSNAGTDVRYDNDTTIFFIWSAASDDDSGVKNYTLTIYSQANCGGSGSDVAAITQTYYEYTSGSEGTYSFKVKAYDNSENEGTQSSCSGNITINTTDVTGPAAPITLTTAADSSSEGNTTIDNDTTIYFVWDAAVDGGVGVKNYTITKYTQGGCLGVGTDIAGITDTYYQNVVAGEGTYSFKVKAFDHLDNEGIQSGCSGDITVDTTVPSTPGGLITAADLSGGADTRYDNDTTSVFFVWSASSDAGSGLKDYTLTWYNGANCSNTATIVTGITSTNYELTTISGGITYSFKVRAYDNVLNEGNLSGCSGNITIDVTGPSAPTTLKTTADSNIGDDVRYDTADGTIYFVWNAASDSGSGIKNYTLTRYDLANCGGGGSDITTITQTYYEYAGAEGTTYSFIVKAYDNQDNVGTPSSCSGNIKIDTTHPPDLDALSATEGTTLATIDLTIDPPAVVTDIDHIDIRRLAGGVAPSCSTGTIARTFISGSLPDPGTPEPDDTEKAEGTFSYSACIYDAAGNETLSSYTATSITSKAQLAFVTTGTQQGNFGAGNPAGGLYVADDFCRTTAAGSALVDPRVTEEVYWKAVLSDSSLSASSRLNIVGNVRTVDLLDIISTDGSSPVEFWDGLKSGLTNYPITDEDGLTNALGDAWTGSTVAGLGAGAGKYCNDWMSNNPGDMGHSGNVDFVLTAAHWIDKVDNTCDTAQHFYCISQYPTKLDLFSAATSGTGGGVISLTLDPPADVNKFSQIVVKRLLGTTAPDSACSNGTLVTTVNPVTTSTVNYEDSGITPGTDYSYRACITDKYGKISETHAATATSSN